MKYFLLLVLMIFLNPSLSYAQSTATLVKTEIVKKEQVNHVIQGDGAIVPWREIIVASEASGLKVLDALYDEGDYVNVGSVILKLQNNILLSNENQAKATLSDAMANFRFADSDYKRAQELVKTSAISAQTLEQRQNSFLSSQAKVMLANAQLQEIQAKLEQTVIRAPVSGMISKRSILPGSVVVSGQEVFRIIQDNRLELDAKIPELNLSAIQPRQIATIYHGQDSIKGTIRAISPVVGNDNRLGTVHISIEDSNLKIGMFATTDIVIGSADNPLVPLESVVYRNSKPVVFIAEKKDNEMIAKIATVKLGQQVGSFYEVLDGIQEGQQVITSGVGFLKDQERVREQK